MRKYLERVICMYAHADLGGAGVQDLKCHIIIIFVKKNRDGSGSGRDFFCKVV